MLLVVIESPYGNRPDGTRASPDEVERNVRYLRAAMHDCFRRGEAPFASHGLYTQPGVLNDDNPSQRALGIGAGFAWARVADMRVFYVDLGWTIGMLQGKREAERWQQNVQIRTLPGWEG